MQSSRVVDRTEQFELRHKEDGGVHLLYVSGSFDEHTAERVWQVCMEIMQDAHRPQLVIAHVNDDYEFDSHGLGLLAWLNEYAKAREGTFYVVPSAAMTRVFKTTGCHSFFQTWPSS